LNHANSIVLASHQPDFFPWMGYFYKMFRSDLFVFSDNVLYSKTGRHNYNDIKTANGPHRFTIPIHYHVRNLNEIHLAVDEKTIDKMIKTLWQEYKKADQFSKAFPFFEELLSYSLNAGNLADFNRCCIMRIADKFGLTASREFFLSSELDLKERRDARCIEMCKLLGANTYLSGEGAKDYHIEADYRRNGLYLVYANYQPIKYEQVNGDFVPNMSVIDYVMNCGFNLPKEWNHR